MWRIAVVPIAVAITGALLWGLAKNAKLQDAGRGLFFIGVFWAVQFLSGKL